MREPDRSLLVLIDLEAYIAWRLEPAGREQWNVIIYGEQDCDDPFSSCTHP